MDKQDFEKAVLDVSKVFDTPEDICHHADLTREQKLKLLQQWEYDLRSLQVAADEAMTSTKPGRTGELLKQVKDCRTELGIDRSSEKPGAPTKQGGS